MGEGLSQKEHDAFYKNVVDRFIDAASKIGMGYGLDESIQMGPIRDVKKKENVLNYIEKGLEDGAELRLDGRDMKITGDYPEDCFIGATLVSP